MYGPCWVLTLSIRSTFSGLWQPASLVQGSLSSLKSAWKWYNEWETPLAKPAQHAGLSAFRPETGVCRCMSIISSRPVAQSVSSKQSLSAYCMPFPLPNPRAFERLSMGTSLAAQWFCLPMQATRARLLVWEDSTCRGAAKPVSHGYWSLCA